MSEVPMIENPDGIETPPLFEKGNELRTLELPQVHSATVFDISGAEESKQEPSPPPSPPPSPSPSPSPSQSQSQSTSTKDPGAERWLWCHNVSKRGAVLVFRSSALASAEGVKRKEDIKFLQNMPAKLLHMTYKTYQAETKLICRLLDGHGLQEVQINCPDFNLLWTGSHPKPDTLRSLTSHQRINHFPRSYELTRKDRLYKNIERMQHAKGQRHFDFIPQTFVMPAEYKELCNMHYRIRGPWIVKPVASSRGRGIHIVNSPNQVPLDEPLVVAKYIANPLLIGGHKCDLRLYVAVTCFDPLLAYLYEEGLVRFATVPYDNSPRQLWNPCMHLCNYSINKYHCDYVKSDDPSAEDVGHKWTLSALLRHLKARDMNTARLMEDIEDLIIKSLMASAQSIVSACRMFVSNPSTCFELFGFDILIDDTLKPWLLEVNLSPSLGCDTPLDVRLKSAMLADLLTLVGMPAVDPILRPNSTASTASLSAQQSILSKQRSQRMKIGSYRRVQSADTLSGVQSVTGGMNRHGAGGGRLCGSTVSLSPDESRLVRMARTQYERRGGFVRIFPTVDSWAKYSQYLDRITGVPCSITPLAPPPTNGLTTCSFVLPHNYNLMLHQKLFPQSKWDESLSAYVCSYEGVVHSSLKSSTDRLGRYERMLSQGFREPFEKNSSEMVADRSDHDNRIKGDVKRLLGKGSKLTQGEARRAFSHYLMFVLKRLSTKPFDENGQLNLIVKFLQKVSVQLKTPYFVKAPSQKLSEKDRGAVVAKQLSDFLYIYNRETELYSDNVDRAHHVPNKLFAEFLAVSSESDLEEVLVLNMQHNRLPKSTVLPSGLQVLIRCVPMLSSPVKVRPLSKHQSVDRNRNRLTVKVAARNT